MCDELGAQKTEVRAELRKKNTEVADLSERLLKEETQLADCQKALAKQQEHLSDLERRMQYLETCGALEDTQIARFTEVEKMFV